MTLKTLDRAGFLRKITVFCTQIVTYVNDENLLLKIVKNEIKAITTIDMYIWLKVCANLYRELEHLHKPSFYSNNIEGEYNYG